MRASFRKELKRQVRLAVSAAIGFTIAFAWRNAIFDTFQSFVAKSLDLQFGNFVTEVYTAIFISFLGVIFILITSKILEER